MTADDRSVERAISEQHRRLDAMFEEILGALREGESREVIQDAFSRLREAIESHLDQEDRLYYPPLRALRPAHRTDLDGLIVAHTGFRTRLEGIGAQLGDPTLAAAERSIAAFATAFAAHEASEEQLLSRIDAEIAEAAALG